LPEVVDELMKAGIAALSDGAVVIWFGEGKPPAIVRKRDGAFTYTTTDLATVRYRMHQWKPDALLYVVDARQALHFQNIFDAARRWGFGHLEFEHISFGSVLNEAGKPLKSREGGNLELGALLDEAVKQAEAIYTQTRQESLERGEDVPDLAPGELQEIAEAVGLGAVKYADLSQNRTSDYVFSFAKMLAMNGNTGTYMQYAYVRNRGIFRKAGADVARYRADPPEARLQTPHERALALQLLRLQERLSAAAAEYQPSIVTAYLWDLAKTYSGFFQNCPVIKAESPELKESRLLLCDLTARVLQRCLHLLGIRTVERM
jgi:arginyl-tRNA synthetase